MTALAVLALAAGAAAAPKPSLPAYLRSVTVVRASGAPSADGRALSKGASVRPGSAISLPAGSALVLRLGGAGVLEFTGPASFRLDAGDRPGVALDRGGVLAVLPHLRSPFNVHAREIVAAVRGTDFFVDAEEQGPVYLCVCHGTVEVSEDGAGGYRKTIRAEHHSASRYRRENGRFLVSSAGLEGHSDAALAALHRLAH